MARVKGGGWEWTLPELKFEIPEMKFEIPDPIDLDAILEELAQGSEKFMREMEESKKERRVIRWARDGEKVEVNFLLGTVTVRRLVDGVELESR